MQNTISNKTQPARNRKKFLQHEIVHLWENPIYSILNSEKLNAHLLRSGTVKDVHPLLQLPFKIVLEALQKIRQEKEIDVIHIEKEVNEVHLSLLMYIILHIGNLQESIIKSYWN